MEACVKKKLTLIIILCLILSFTGCAEGKKNTEGKAGDLEPVTFDWYINYSWFVTAWGGNVVSDAITEKTGVSVNFISPPGNEAEKLNALIASDSLPANLLMK